MVRISERVSALHISPIRRVTKILSEANVRREMISFGGGAPSLPPPQEVSSEIMNQMQTNPQGSTSYTGTRGMPELRALIANDWKKNQGTSYDPEKEVIVTDGATEALFDAFLSMLDPGDEVVVMNPTYLGYFEAVQLAGARLKQLPVSVVDGYQPNLETAKALISDKTRVVVLLSPDNPTGRIVKSDFTEGLMDLATDHDFWILWDSTYRDIVYDAKSQPKISELPGANERLLSIGSFSKEASSPGLRIGYALGPKGLIDGIEKIKQYTSLAPNTLSQYAMIKFLQGDVKERYLKTIVLPTYQSRRDIMSRMITEFLPESNTTKPEGAFYFFVDIRRYLRAMHMADEQLSERLLKEHGVAVIPGSFFGSQGKGHVRLTFVSEPEDRIETGIKRIASAVSHLATAPAFRRRNSG